jgi:hypothetical protein
VDATSDQELGTPRQQVSRLLDIADRAKLVAAKATGARDAASALAVERQSVSKVLDYLERDRGAAEIDDIKAQLAAMNAALAGKRGSAQRADVAPAPRIARRSETLQ